MKNFLNLLTFIAITLSIASCQSVDSTKRGVEVSWGGETNMGKVYPPGMHWGVHWITDDLIEYDVTQQTITEKYEFNDKNSMLTGVEVSVDFSIDETKPQYLHTKISDWKAKLHSTLKGAAKEVIPQYAAADLNLGKRQEGENKLSDILKKELPEFYLVFDRVRITDVDLPGSIAKTAELNANQEQLNNLAEKKKTEAENNYHAAEWDAKTKDVLSKPAMLALKRLEIDMEYAKKGVSPYGTNNVFGSSPSLLLNR